MATYDLDEQEQIDELKSWWKLYGNQLLNILLAVFAFILAWQGWNWYQQRQMTQASMVYHLLQEAIQKKDTARVKAASGELLEKHSGSSYASLGALLASKSFIDSGDAQTAKAQLQWVATHDRDDLRDLARLRLATILLDEKSYDEALKLLDGNAMSAFEVRFLDIRGDILKAQEKKEEARQAYQSALKRLAEGSKPVPGLDLVQDWQVRADNTYREILQQKLDALGGGKQ